METLIKLLAFCGRSSRSSFCSKNISIGDWRRIWFCRYCFFVRKAYAVLRCLGGEILTEIKNEKALDRNTKLCRSYGATFR
jgi:hypothetical protein